MLKHIKFGAGIMFAFWGILSAILPILPIIAFFDVAIESGISTGDILILVCLVLGSTAIPVFLFALANKLMEWE